MTEGHRYRHYKGGLYRMLAIGKIEATLEQCVVYRAEKDGTVWVRPYDDFFSTVPNPNLAGNALRVPRFQLAREDEK